jgi:FeS assembly SUF system regulator
MVRIRGGENPSAERQAMIRLTKQSDYGIVLMTHLASTPGRQFSAPELAAELQVPLPITSKVLKLLARGGLLASHRGVKGGYCLARQPEEITVAGIISALEGPIAITECIEHSPAGALAGVAYGDCSREPFCAVRANWQLINHAVQRALAGITLADMTQPLRPAALVRLGAQRAAHLEAGQG